MFQPDKLADLISKKVEADPFSLESLEAWLLTKTGDYPYWDIYGCLICQYLDHLGIKYHSSGGNDYAPNTKMCRVALPWPANIVSGYPSTIEGALERTRAAIAARAA